MSIAERLRKEGEARGEARGKAEGEVHGRSATLLRQLQRRFGDLPKRVVKRVEGAKVTELEIWTDRVLDAPTLEGVFAAG